MWKWSKSFLPFVPPEILYLLFNGPARTDEILPDSLPYSLPGRGRNGKNCLILLFSCGKQPFLIHPYNPSFHLKSNRIGMDPEIAIQRFVLHILTWRELRQRPGLPLWLSAKDYNPCLFIYLWHPKVIYGNVHPSPKGGWFWAQRTCLAFKVTVIVKYNILSHWPVLLILYRFWFSIQNPTISFKDEKVSALQEGWKPSFSYVLSTI